MDHPVCLKLEETVSRPVDFQKRIIVVLEATFDVEAECTHFRQYLAVGPARSAQSSSKADHYRITMHLSSLCATTTPAW